MQILLYFKEYSLSTTKTPLSNDPLSQFYYNNTLNAFISLNNEHVNTQNHLNMVSIWLKRVSAMFLIFKFTFKRLIFRSGDKSLKLCTHTHTRILMPMNNWVMNVFTTCINFIAV